MHLGINVDYKMFDRYIMRLTLIDPIDTLNIVLFDNEVELILNTSKDELTTMIINVTFYTQ